MCRLAHDKPRFGLVSPGSLATPLFHADVLLTDGSEGLFVYVCTKWSREEIDAAEQRRLDDMDSLVSMRTRSCFSHSTQGRRGILHENLIAHTMYGRRLLIGT